MYKLSDLRNLEKNCNIHLAMVDFVVDEINEKENTRRRILRDHNGRYFFHSMKDGEVIECFEILLSWKAFDNKLMFAYTPDGKHPYEIEVNTDTNIILLERKGTPIEFIEPGDKAEYDGNTIELVNYKTIKVNGNYIPVIDDPAYVYKLMKGKIKARDGAIGLFHFLDGIAEERKNGGIPLFSAAFGIICDKYGKGKVV